MTYLAGISFPGHERFPAIHCDGAGCGAVIRIDGLPPRWFLDGKPKRGWVLIREPGEKRLDFCPNCRSPEPVAEVPAAGEASAAGLPWRREYSHYLSVAVYDLGEVSYFIKGDGNGTLKPEEAAWLASNLTDAAFVAAGAAPLRAREIGKSPLSEPARAKCGTCGSVNCTTCSGTGQATPREPLYPADVRFSGNCPDCHGTGRSPEGTPGGEGKR